MAYISFNPADFFSPLLWTGDGNNGRSITGVGFQPDMVWIKEKEGTNNHMLSDSARGPNNKINPNTTAANDTATNSLQAFGADGFTAGTNTEINASGNTYVAWNWKGGTTSGITTDGATTITPSAYSFNADAGISILKYTGNTTGGAKLAHGLGKVPALFIAKDLGSTESWTVYHQSLGATKFLSLNGTGAASTSSVRWNDEDPTTTNMVLGSDTSVNNTSMMGYCFAEVKGFSSFGEYTGTGQLDGPMIFTGFRPAFVMVKITDTTDGWYMWDNKRSPSGGYNVLQYRLEANQNFAQGTSANYMIDVVSNGFKLRDNNVGDNGAGNSFVYMAFAAQPLVSSNDKAGTAY